MQDREARASDLKWPQSKVNILDHMIDMLRIVT